MLLSRRRAVWRTLVVTVLAAPVGCVNVPGGDVGAGAVADFSLEDVNPDSPSYQKTVSPRDYLGQISAWYFGHST